MASESGNRRVAAERRREDVDLPSAREAERFGGEGEEGDALFETEMAAFKAEEFDESHCQARVIKQKLGQVGL